MSEAQKIAAREEAMRKLGMAPPPSATPAAAAKAEDKPKEEKQEEEAIEFEAEEEADDQDLEQFMQEGGSDLEASDSDEDFDDFLSEKPAKKQESKEEREARIAKELEARKKGAIENEKERERKKKEHEEWLASMTEEMRNMYFEDQKRKQRQAEQEMRAAEEEREMRRQEEMRRKAAASGGGDAAPSGGGGGKGGADKTDSKWSYEGDRLVKEVVERKGPKKSVKEIQLRIPSRRVGSIIGKGGVNIKIIEGRSRAQVKVFKASADAAPTEDTLVTVKGSPESVDIACETINKVFEQAKAHRAAMKK